MNKKFSTLLALALMAGSVSAQNWQTSSFPQGAYRTYGTLNGSEEVFDASTSTFVPMKNFDADLGEGTLMNGSSFDKFINFVDDTKLYQLELAIDDELQQGAKGRGAYVLIQERDYETGKIYLRAVPKARTIDNYGAKLNASLWTIKYSKPDGVSGGYFTYVNKETGYTLSFDHSVLDNEVISELRDGVAEWSWYTVNQVANDFFDFERVYSYLHNQESDQVMYLAFGDEAANDDDLRVKLSEDGFQYRKTAGKLVQAKVISSADAGSRLENIADEALQLRPVVAMPFHMTAEQFNTRMDADDKENDSSFKFTLSEELIGDDVFVENEFTAVDFLFWSDMKKTLEVLNTLNTDGMSFTEGEVNYSINKHSYYLSFNVTGTEDYLLVDTVRYEEEAKKPSASPAVKFNVRTPRESDNDYMKARYVFRATYFPTNDSLLIEPLNAAVQSDKEWEDGTPWAASKCTQSFVIAQFSKANTLVNDYNYNGSKTVSLGKAEINGLGEVFTVAKDGLGEFDLISSIERPFAYLTRTTVPSGLYFINVAGNGLGTNWSMNRGEGMSIVHNMGTHLMYDTEARNQDYNDMPATMWVVEQLGCDHADNSAANKYVRITNREYSDMVFEGQLYTCADGDLMFIDRTEGVYDNGFNASNGWFNASVQDGNKFWYKDHMAFTAVEDEAALEDEHHGYLWLPEDFLNNGLENNFKIQLNNFLNGDLVIEHVEGEDLEVVEDGETIFEIGEAVLPDNSGVITNSFGYAAAGLPGLERKAYVIKVKDQNLIDNDRIYVALVKEDDGRYYYRALPESEIDGIDAHPAYFYLKADQFVNDTTEDAYVLVNINNPESDDLALENGWTKAEVESGANMGTIRTQNLEDEPNDVASAFFFAGIQVNQYIDIDEDYAVDLNGNIKIFNGQNEYLFEDLRDASNVSAIQDINPDFAYLGIENKSVNDREARAAFYVDEVVYDYEYMQRYLLGVRVDSVADGAICKTKTHGYWSSIEAAEAADETHVDAYNGYTYGWFLVNLKDSVGLSSNMMANADLYKFNAYTRLGFVKAIHQVVGDVEYLYVLNSDVEFEDIMTIKNNSGEKKVLDPDMLTSDYVDTHVLNGNVNTVHTWSFRKLEDEPELEDGRSEGFLLESVCDNVASFEGSWVKVHNGVPVVIEENAIDNHENELGAIVELIGQSGIFYFAPTEDEATANEEISAAGVQVIAGNGNVTIAGAAGKKVVIANILGQTVANTIIASDNATIAVPAGVVVVKVEGEAAVKAIVK